MYRTDSDLARWQETAIEWLPKILAAIAILLVAWLLARMVKWAIARLVDKIPALRRHHETEPGKTVGSLLGDVAYWLIILIGIMLALQPLNLANLLDPVRELTTNTFAFIPNLIAAGLIFFIGLVVARIAQRVVEGALIAADADAWVRKTGLVDDGGAGAGAPATPAGGTPEVTKQRTSITHSIGLIVFFLIMIPVTIAALDVLAIDAISGPATEMLRTILDAIPNVIGALILLAIGYFVGKLAKQATEQILPSMGFDRAVAALGFSPQSTTPSRTVGTVVMVAILIFFAIKAAELLDSAIIAVMLAQVLELGSRVLFGAFIIIAGVVIARIVAGLVSGAGTEGWLPAILKWSVIALAVAMGLRFMGLANEIVILGFGLILGSAAVACALAFGLGGRPTAHKLLERWTEANGPPRAPGRPRAPRPPGDDQPPLV